MLNAISTSCLLILLFSIVTADSNLETVKYCSRYVECASVSLLEERLCLGNTRKRPYWLPFGHDPKKCHEKLKNDYKLMESYEADLDHQLNACLTEKATNMTEAQKATCSPRILRLVPRFSFGRTITYVPTNCFTGLERRRERECSTSKFCCGAFDKCEFMLTDSAIARELMTLRMNLQQRAKDCELGKEVKPLVLPASLAESLDDEPSWAPSGNVNVRFTDVETLKNNKIQNRQQDQNGAGFVNVRVHEQGSDSANAVQRELEALQRKGKETFGQVSTETKGSNSEKVKFNQLSDSESTESVSTLKADRNSLTITSNETPKLKFPENKSLNENSELERKLANLPKNLDDHDKKYDDALKKTNEYKEVIRQLSRESKNSVVTSDFVNSGLDSLVKAGTLSSSTDKESGIASGKVEKVSLAELEHDSEITVNEGVVTSSPLILVTNENQTETTSSKPNENGCTGRPKITITKTIKYEKILTLLGEEPESNGIKEIRDLINSWQTNFRKKVVTAKDKAKNKEIEKALEDLVSQFDDINLKMIKDQANATFNVEDYPHDDAEITANNCDPSPITELSNDVKTAELAQLKDEHGDVVVIDEGVPKIMVNSGKVVKTSDNLDEVSLTQTKEEPIEWHNEEYRKEIENFRKSHNIHFSNTTTRNDTTCDAYMRCRAQMHVAVDQCAWSFASSKVVTSLAESSESLLFKSEEPCDPAQIPLYEELYEMIIQRNTKLRTCLDRRNEKVFSESICIPYNKQEQQVYDHSLLRVLSNKYTKAMDCYQDANKIQEKCSKLRQCCPHFDSCREEMIDVNLEQAIISMTARLNDEKQSCIKDKARDSFKKAVKGILGRSDEESLELLRSGRYGLDIQKGAQLMKRMR